MTPTNLQPVIAVQDDSCHWYVIPKQLEVEFRRLNDVMNSENQSEFEQAEDKFIELFSGYRTGGDLNNIQLYADANNPDKVVPR